MLTSCLTEAPPRDTTGVYYSSDDDVDLDSLKRKMCKRAKEDAAEVSERSRAWISEKISSCGGLGLPVYTEEETGAVVAPPEAPPTPEPRSVCLMFCL